MTVIFPAHYEKFKAPMHVYSFYLCIIIDHHAYFSFWIFFLKVFEIDDVKAWKSVLISVTSYALGIFLISKAPWYLLPLAWAWTGTAITGVSSIHTFFLIIIS